MLTMKQIISRLGYPGIPLLIIVLGVLCFFPSVLITNSIHVIVVLNITFFFVYFLSWICSKHSKNEFRLFFFIGLGYFLWSVLISQNGICAGFALIALMTLFYLDQCLFSGQKAKVNDVFRSPQSVTYLLKREENQVTGVIFCSTTENQSKNHLIHIPFCPPFASQPEVKIIKNSKNTISVTHLFVATYGMRMEIKTKNESCCENQTKIFKIHFQVTSNPQTPV